VRTLDKKTTLQFFLSVFLRASSSRFFARFFLAVLFCSSLLRFFVMGLDFGCFISSVIRPCFLRGVHLLGRFHNQACVISVISPYFPSESNKTGVGSQLVGAVGLFPGESFAIVASKMAECGGLFVDWSAQVE
jgi:hypothetical protein